MANVLNQDKLECSFCKTSVSKEEVTVGAEHFCYKCFNYNKVLNTSNGFITLNKIPVDRDRRNKKILELMLPDALDQLASILSLMYTAGDEPIDYSVMMSRPITPEKKLFRAQIASLAHHLGMNNKMICRYFKSVGSPIDEKTVKKYIGEFYA